MKLEKLREFLDELNSEGKLSSPQAATIFETAKEALQNGGTVSLKFALKGKTMVPVVGVKYRYKK